MGSNPVLTTKLKTNIMVKLEVKMIEENGSISLGFSSLLVDYITRTKKWNYVFECLKNNKKIDKSNWDY
jgi:hypothetical protein